MSYLNSEIDPQRAAQDLGIVRDALGRAARSSTGDGFYFFIWGSAVPLILLLQRYLPSTVANWLTIALYAAAIVASGMTGAKQGDKSQYGWRYLIVWLVLVGEAVLFGVLFFVLAGRGFNVDYLDVINVMIFAFGIIMVGTFSEIKVAVVGYAMIIIALALPALLPDPGDRIVAVAALIGISYWVAGWLLYRMDKRGAVQD
jgi:hypothetical protein